EEEVRRAAQAMLARLGFEVLEPGDGAEAVEVFREHADRITLVLLDLIMPRLACAKILPELAAIRADVPVIVVSAYAVPAVATHADRGGRGKRSRESRQLHHARQQDRE